MSKQISTRSHHAHPKFHRRVVTVLILGLALVGSGCDNNTPTAVQAPVPPGIPSGLTATAAPTSITLTWATVSDATGYIVYWDLDESVQVDDSAIAVAAPPFVHANLTNGTTYHYRVAAVNDAGTSDLSTQIAATPTQALGIRLIACGDFCSFLVDAQGFLYAWGRNDDGQLGIGSFQHAHEPVLVAGVTDVVAVSSGWRHTLVLTGSGRLYAMGYNTYGALGVGDNQPHWSPTLVSAPTNFTAVAAGRTHSLGVTGNGDVYVWGSNTGGHLGLGYEGGWVEVPTLVLTSFWHTPGLVAAGNNDNFFKPFSDGTHDSPLSSWGSNSGGLLGRVTDGDLVLGNTPSAIANTDNYTAISTRYLHVLTLHESGAVYSWGVNAEGQLGRYSDATSRGPNGVELIDSILAVAAGSFHSLALGADGRVMSWGGNGFGQLGDGTYNNSDVRTWVNNLTDITMIAAGGSHNLALRSDGTLWAWGANTYGQLGDGNVVGHWEPVRVNGF